MLKSFLAICGCSLLLCGPTLAQQDPPEYPRTDDLELFVIGTELGPNPIAKCSTLTCFLEINTEILDIADMYCDTGIGGNLVPGSTGYAPEGCVRWWEDQSLFNCGACGTGAHHDEWETGHEHGQDDVAKPAYVEFCRNNNPCARLPTVAEMGPNAGQIACLELQNTDTLMVNGSFSIFLLAAPRGQNSDWWYFGNPNNGLRHRVADDSLAFRTSGTAEVQITGPGAIDVSRGEWQLIEIHRALGNYQVIVNKEVITLPGAASNTAPYEHRYLGAQNCNGISGGMVGDIAAFLLYSRVLPADDRAVVRDYLDFYYKLDLLFGDGFEYGDLRGWSGVIP